MSRDGTQTRDRPASTSIDDFDAEYGVEDGREQPSKSGETDDLRSRTAKRAARLFSPRHFIGALLVTVVGLFAVSTVIPLPGAGLLGVLAASFLFGLVVGQRRYVEAALAGAIAAAASTLLDFAVIAFFGGFGISLAVVAGGIGAVVAALGTYFGRDLRNGLTREV